MGICCKNYKTDIEEDLAHIIVPVLAVFGDADENVGVPESLHTFGQIFSENNHQNYKSSLFKDASHTFIDINKISEEDTVEDILHRIIHQGKNTFVLDFIAEILEHF
ncbi:hypothetical protein AB832_03045 [Flavobacteriaceae bacterium (ex Bugula neritina AB1)]|nr:hypothetical protein AB832_03045 [Flavobacteriaceae bacterium (ex Bugula neritina AB1)]